MNPPNIALLAEIEAGIPADPQYASEAWACDRLRLTCAALRHAWRALACVKCDARGMVVSRTQAGDYPCYCGKAAILDSIREMKP